MQIAKNGNANYVYDGSNDVAMINMRREAAAQGLDRVKVWALLAGLLHRQVQGGRR